LPVVNPNNPKSLSKFKPQAVMTNAYLLWKNKREKALKRGVHKVIGFEGPVMTDSGAFQLMQYGNVDVTNREVVEFQEAIGSDIATPLDLPGLGTRVKMVSNLKETIKRARECKELIHDSKSLWVGPIQGGAFPTLRRKSARAMRELDFDVYAVGSVVPLMNDYRFAEAFDALWAAKQELPLNKPVHFFGAGHPMMFAFAVALGADLFDSAAYSLFAQRGKYLTITGTKELSELEYLPCSCPVCRKHEPGELDERMLAEHNLWVSLEEMARIRQAIHENTLWELLEERARAHPQLSYAFKRFSRYRNYLESLDVFTKKRFFMLSGESRLRPEVYRHTQRMKELSGRGIGYRQLVDLPPFKQVPVELAGIYPFGQRVLPGEREQAPAVPDWRKADGIARYLYGVGLPRGLRFEKGKTGRLRRAYKGDELLVSFRASDGMIIPHGFARIIHKKTRPPAFRVQVDDEVQEFARKGKTVFAKFVRGCGPEVRAGMEVLVVNSKDELLASGTALLSAREMLDFDEGPAVKIRVRF